MGSSKVVPLRGKTDLTLSLKRSFEKKFPKLGVFVKMFHPTPFLVLEGHAAAITDLTWSPSHLFLLSSSLDGSVRLWSISSNDCLCSFEHDEAVTSVTFHPLEHHLFLSGCFDGRIRLWTLFDKRVLAWNEVINNSLTAVSFNSEGTMAIAGTMTGDLLFYDVPNLKYETQINLVAQLKSMLSGKTKHTCKVTCIEPMISFREGEEDRIIVSSTDSRIRIINLRDKSVFQAFKGHTSHNTFFRGVLSEDGRYLASPSDDKTVCFWEASKGLEEGMATPSPFATSFRASSDKMTGPDKLLFDDPVTCATFAPSQLMYWKNSFEMTNRLQFSASFNADPFIIIATGDSQGQISIYRNEESASNSSIRSMKEFPTLMTPTSSGLPEFTERRSRRSSFSNVVEAAMSRASSVTPTKELKPPGILQKNQSASQLPSGKELGSAFLRSPGSALTSNSPFVTAIQEEVDDGSVIRLALPPFSRNRHYSS